jgi:hypothetical protein
MDPLPLVELHSEHNLTISVEMYIIIDIDGPITLTSDKAKDG